MVAMGGGEWGHRGRAVVMMGGECPVWSIVASSMGVFGSGISCLCQPAGNTKGGSGGNDGGENETQLT